MGICALTGCILIVIIFLSYVSKDTLWLRFVANHSICSVRRIFAWNIIWNVHLRVGLFILLSQPTDRKSSSNHSCSVINSHLNSKTSDREFASQGQCGWSRITDFRTHQLNYQYGKLSYGHVVLPLNMCSTISENRHVCTYYSTEATEPHSKSKMLHWNKVNNSHTHITAMYCFSLDQRSWESR